MEELPWDLDPGAVGGLLAAAAGFPDVGSRIDVISRRLLGAPYRSHPLIGSADEPEVFTASLEAFDCVTYVEAVLALAWSRRVEEFADCLRRIRYAHGVVDWKRRNHYMSGWIRQNQRAGFLRDRTGGAGVVARTRLLSVVSGLPRRAVRIQSVDKRAFMRRSGEIRKGDLVFFASIRKHLDIFHCGLLFPEDGLVRMRHAARSRGSVVEQDLAVFLAENRMSGVILVRSEEPFRAAA